MDGLALIIGLGIYGFIWAYIALKMDFEKHFFLQLLVLGFLAVLLLQVPRAAIEYGQDCTTVLSNQTVSGNFTSYEYREECFNHGDTDVTFFKAATWWVRIFWTYLIVWIIYHLTVKLIDYFKRKKGSIV